MDQKNNEKTDKEFENISEIKKWIEEIIQNNNINQNKINNYKKLFPMLDTIESSITEKAIKNKNELMDINKSIEENIEIFKNICINTK